MSDLLSVAVDPRFAIVWSALPPVGMGFWALWRYQADRKDKRREADETREMTRDERRTSELDKMMLTLNQEQMNRVGDLRQENIDLRARLAEKTKEADHWWSIARYWHGVAHDLLRLFRNLRHNALNMMQWIQSAAKLHPDLGLPVSIEDVPDRPDIPMGLEDVEK